MEREILLLGDARLYQVCEPVRREELAAMPALIADMRDTILAYRRKMGAGRAIAAPQIGVMKRVVCMCLEDAPVAFLNPVLSFPDGEMMEVLDDCMSFPHLLVRLKRHRRCAVRYRDLDWAEREWALEGRPVGAFAARMRPSGWRAGHHARRESARLCHAGALKEGSMKTGLVLEGGGIARHLYGGRAGRDGRGGAARGV